MRTILAALSVVVAVGGGVRADEVVIPAETNAATCVPFGCDTQIQQVFDARLFPARMRVEAIVLFNRTTESAEGDIERARYLFFLSTTRATSQTITLDFDANRGRRVEQVIDWTVSDEGTFFTGALTLPLDKPFIYDPRKGNLLVEVQKDMTDGFGDGHIYVDASTAADGITLVTSRGGVQRGVGFTIGFVGKFLGPFDTL